MKPIVETEIIKIILKFNKNKSPGHDDIGNNVLKKISKEIAIPLTRIFNLSISSGEVPDSFKIAKVVPIYKKHDPQVFSNYRPVSVLPSFSKIIEWLQGSKLTFFTHSQNFASASKIYSLNWNHCSLRLRSKSGPHILIIIWFLIVTVTMTALVTTAYNPPW